MEFLKKFFNDESVVVGLCKFEQIRPKYCQNPIEENVFFKPAFETKITYRTDFSKNMLLY